MATVAQTFEPKGFDLFSSNQPTLLLSNGTTIPISGYQFSATSQVMYRRFTAVAYLSGNVTCRIRWYSSSTSGNAQFSAAIAAITPGDAQSVLTKALATATSTTTAVGATASMINTTDVTVSNLDSLAADDEVWLAVTRSASTTVASGPVVVSVEVIYASTAGVGAGNVSNAGASTDNAIARFDLATGQVIQNSVVTIDDTTGTVTLPAGASGKYIGGGASDVQEVTVDSASITTITTVMTFALPGAGTYDIDANLLFTLATTASAQNTSVRLAYSGTTTRAAYSALQQTNTTNTLQLGAVVAINTDITASVQSGTAATPLAIYVRGSITVSTSGNLTVQVTRATNGMVVKAGSSGRATPKLA